MTGVGSAGYDSFLAADGKVHHYLKNRYVLLIRVMYLVIISKYCVCILSLDCSFDCPIKLVVLPNKVVCRKGVIVGVQYTTVVCTVP